MKHHGMLFNVVEHSYCQRSLGIYRIAHHLRDQGLDIEVIDYANFWTIDQLKELFKSRVSSCTKFIGFSHLFNIWAPVLEQFCGWVKQHYPEIKIISGSSVNPNFESHYIDYYIRGFGEHAIVALLDYIISNGPAPNFNLLSTGGKKIIDANVYYPAFPMHSLMVKYQDRDFLEPHEWLTIEFARGCKFNCKYCNFPVLGVKGDYSRDADDFEAQMRDTYDRYGISSYIVADETFNDRTEKITKFADVVEQLPFRPYFSGYIRADLLAARPEEKHELLRMNFLGHHCGIESFDQDNLRIVGKGMNVDRLTAGLLESKCFFTKHVGTKYICTLSFIVGLPHDTMQGVNDLKSWLITNWQGQSYDVYPLMIPVGELDKKSTFSIEYSKYGYTEMSKQEVAQEKQKISTQLTDSHYYNPLVNKYMPWKSPTMNFITALLAAHEVGDLKQSHDFRSGAMAMGQILTSACSLEEKLSLPSFRNLRVTGVDHLKSYIHKKLSL
jgi:radical SAM superfamily enzyme YgiQ (UPF0313 family)